MKKLLIKYIAYNYDYKVFGKTRAHLRVVNPLILFFCIAGLYNLLNPGFDFLQAIAFTPFIAVFVIWLNFRNQKFEEYKLTWEQYFQQLSSLGASNAYERARLSSLRQRMNIKFENTSAKTVEFGRFIFPWAVIAISFLLYAIFGFDEAGFSTERFF